MTVASVPRVRRYSDIFMPHFRAFLRIRFFSVLKTRTLISSVRLRITFTSFRRGYRGEPLSYQRIRGNWEPDGYTNPMLVTLTDKKAAYSHGPFRVTMLHSRRPPSVTQMTAVTVKGEAGRYRHSQPSVTQAPRSRKHRHDRQHRRAAPG